MKERTAWAEVTLHVGSPPGTCQEHGMLMKKNFFQKKAGTNSFTLTLKVSYSLTADRGPANVTNSQAIFRAYSPYRPFTDIQEPGIFMADSEKQRTDL